MVSLNKSKARHKEWRFKVFAKWFGFYKKLVLIRRYVYEKLLSLALFVPVATRLRTSTQASAGLLRSLNIQDR